MCASAAPLPRDGRNLYLGEYDLPPYFSPVGVALWPYWIAVCHTRLRSRADLPQVREEIERLLLVTRPSARHL